MASTVSKSSPPLRAVEIFTQHILQQLKQPASATARTSPLFVALQGPQGSGKTTITRSLVSHLKSSGVSVGVLSSDDLYHTHTNLVRVAKEYPDNPLLSGRGQPGTHDVDLGKEVLDRISKINRRTETVELPIFDKSLFNGEGDRSQSGVTIEGPLDVFILEGWSMGFSPIPEEEVKEKRDTSPPSSPLRQYTTEQLQQINRNLEAYTAWYNRFTVFLQIRPTDLDYVYEWRLEQEHAMKAVNGGKGMDDDGVKAFVDRYMPGYHLFLDTIHQNQRWKGHSKTITIDRNRNIVSVENW